MIEQRYQELSQEELYDVLIHIDKQRFKDRYNCANKIFESRGGKDSLDKNKEVPNKIEWIFPMLIFCLVNIPRQSRGL